MIASLMLPMLALAPTAPVEVAPPPEPSRTASQPRTLEEDRLTVCLKQVKQDTALAIDTAQKWVIEVKPPESASAQQCLGVALAADGIWGPAEQAFLAARDALPPAETGRRATLGAAAGNAALADGRPAEALPTLDKAVSEANAAGDAKTGGEIAIDRGRALVALGRVKEAEEAFAIARRDASQDADAWLLSATLARRQNDLAAAQTYIETAARLRPVDLQIGLEAGVIAMLSGREDAARKSWQSVIDADAASEPAKIAKSYLAQLGTP